MALFRLLRVALEFLASPGWSRSSSSATRLSPSQIRVCSFPAPHTFFLIIIDRDASEFTVEGPMSDDRSWNHAVVNAQKAGRNLRCFSMGNMAPEAAAREWQMMQGGKRVTAGSIVTPAGNFD